MERGKADDDVWTIILTGFRDSFCAGGDLKENIASARGQIEGRRSGTRPIRTSTLLNSRSRSSRQSTVMR